MKLTTRRNNPAASTLAAIEAFNNSNDGLTSPPSVYLRDSHPLPRSGATEVGGYEITVVSASAPYAYTATGSLIVVPENDALIMSSAEARLIADGLGTPPASYAFTDDLHSGDPDLSDDGCCPPEQYSPAYGGEGSPRGY